MIVRVAGMHVGIATPIDANLAIDGTMAMPPVAAPTLILATATDRGAAGDWPK
jgi:hypothetical protein